MLLPRRHVAAVAVPWVLTAAALTGCGSSQDTAAAPSTAATSSTSATSLEIELVNDAAGPAETYTLRCDPPGGNHPDPAAACADLAREPQPFAPLAGGRCTQVYGGPATAVVSGTYRGQPVQLRVARTDGCQIAQWDRLGAVLPPVPGALG